MKFIHYKSFVEKFLRAQALPIVHFDKLLVVLSYDKLQAVML